MTIDCGIVLSPDMAKNMTEGSIENAIRVAMYGKMTFSKGITASNNFHSSRMIRRIEAPKAIEGHFEENNEKPTGMEQLTYSPVHAALVNTPYKATDKRLYKQPFAQNQQIHK
ncbi:MAG: hypothetical protein MUF58_06155 [Arcicella sp.]|nr:hypothetical protein [Arcicella sp.]